MKGANTDVSRGAGSIIRQVLPQIENLVRDPSKLCLREFVA